MLIGEKRVRENIEKEREMEEKARGGGDSGRGEGCRDISTQKRRDQGGQN